ncbi:MULTISPECIES: TetR/AcrR family transcriptional regulator [unclassified Phenylobacterium]|uniref:TetR/AcrR family transcriptional regulator n=1 Tax=unclassified Phenylobacterium TaxID=2640670 RepID=UPI0022B317AE|nr:TetR/AcrR family transcriptional regulator [Phenylobacterium sp. NIBR 498073]MBS0490226.1 TetR/AcrR family transcriptional regulator [Pseudomonadota bacterium]WGU38939.1 TetR/AcrR family transcriptional regulator [Phenylobacterium sp. NIBR 498073]
MTWTDQGSRRRPYHVGNLRTLLLDEARALLESGGRSEMNLRALAGRAGIAAGSVYHHYASKAALLAGLAAMGFRELEASLREAAAQGGATPIRTTALAYFDFARAQPALYELMFDAALMGEADVAEARDRAFAVLRELIAAAPSQQGVEPAVIHKVALAVWACGHGAASLTQADESGNSPLMEDVIQGLEALFRPR